MIELGLKDKVNVPVFGKFRLGALLALPECEQRQVNPSFIAAVNQKSEHP